MGIGMFYLGRYSYRLEKGSKFNVGTTLFNSGLTVIIHYHEK